MKEAVLVLVKPDAMSKNLLGDIITRLAETRLELIGGRFVKVSNDLAESHYAEHKGKPFYDELIDFIQGKLSGGANVMALVYYGNSAIKKIREIAGATNPELADPHTIRGSFGRVTTKGVYENAVHASSSKEDGEREVKLWFGPDELTVELFPTKIDNIKKKVWL